MLTLIQILNNHTVCCCPLEIFMDKDTINGRTYFYCDDKKIEVQKQILQYK